MARTVPGSMGKEGVETEVENFLTMPSSVPFYITHSIQTNPGRQESGVPRVYHIGWLHLQDAYGSEVTISLYILPYSRVRAATEYTDLIQTVP